MSVFRVKQVGKLALFACAIGALSVAGCQTAGLSGSVPPATSSLTGEGGGENRVSKPSYSMFFSQGDHLHELISKKKFEVAAKLYEEQRAFFADKADEYAIPLKQVASRLNHDLAPEIDRALAGLKGAKWPAPKTQWSKLRMSLDTAKEALGAYQAVALLQDSNFRYDGASRLAQAYESLAAAISGDMGRHFTVYTHLSEEAFFKVYPLAPPREFIARNFPALKKQFTNATSGQLEAFAKAHSKEMLGDENWNWLGQRFAAAVVAEKPESGGRDIGAVLGAVSRAKLAGFDVKEVPAFNVTFVEATSKTLLERRQIDFEAGIDVDLPITAHKSSLDEALSSNGGSGAGVVVVFDIALAKASRQVLDLKQKKSIFLSGYEKQENVEWELAKDRVRSAQNRSAAGVGLLTLSGTIGMFQESSARQELKETPRYLQVPVYSEYLYDSAQVRARKNLTVNFHIVDRKRGAYFKDSFDINEERHFKVAYRVQETDTNPAKIFTVHDTEKQVTDWEDEAVHIKLSQLIDHYVANKHKERPLENLLALRKSILKDKNIALAKYESEKFEYDKHADPRLDRVVAIYVGEGSMGSGFFVEPDVVLTNWHVVENAEFVEMKLHSGLETFGRVIAKDVRLDLALVKVQTRGKPASFVDSRTVQLGEIVEAIGHPRRYLFTVTRGVISSIRKGKSINLPRVAGKKVLFIQTDAATSPGNSGGPLFLGNRVCRRNLLGKD